MANPDLGGAPFFGTDLFGGELADSSDPYFGEGELFSGASDPYFGEGELSWGTSASHVGDGELFAQTSGVTDGQTVTGAAGEVVPRAQVDGWYIGQDENGAARIYDPATTAPDEIRPITPQTASPSGETTIFVNGINNGPDDAAKAGQTLAETSGDEVYTLYNNAHFGDVAVNNAESPAVEALAETIYHKVIAGEEVRVASTSEGSQVTRVALEQVEARLLDEFGFTPNTNARGQVVSEPSDTDLKAQEMTEELLGQVKVMTYGGNEHRFPVDGPKYLHFVDSGDPGSNLKYQNSEAGEGAVVVYFNSWLPTIPAHDLEGNYLPEIGRFSFDEYYDAHTASDGGVTEVSLDDIVDDAGGEGTIVPF